MIGGGIGPLCFDVVVVVCIVVVVLCTAGVLFGDYGSS